MRSADLEAVLEQLRQAAAAQQRAQEALRSSIEQLAAPAAADPDDASTTGLITTLLHALTHAPTQNDAVHALLTAAIGLLPPSLGAICTETDDQPLTIVGIWHGTDTWQNGAPTDHEVVTQLARRSLDHAIRLPLMHQGIGLGELRLWPLDPSAGTAALAGPGRLLALCAGLGLGGLNLKRRLVHRTVRDALTGLFNRRYMEDTLGRELHRAYRGQSEVGLILCDVSEPSAGSDSGDRALQAIGGILQASFRGSDVCCRMGEQRFGIILPDAGLQDTHRRAQGLLQSIAEIRLPGAGVGTQVLACAGVASFPQHGRSPQDLLLAADSALLMATQQGPGTAAIAERFE